MLLKCSWQLSALFAASVLYAMIGCGESDENGSGGASGAGNGGKSGSSAGGSSGAGPGSGGSAGAGVSGGSGTAGGSSGGSAGLSGDAQGPPPPADGGGSIYSVECRGESRVCGYPSAHCLGIMLPEGGTGFTCSNHCVSDADCSSAPSGAEARAGCVPFTQQSRCVLVCENSGQRFSCPRGMSCYTYPGAQLGYCLWM